MTDDRVEMVAQSMCGRTNPHCALRGRRCVGIAVCCVVHDDARAALAALDAAGLVIVPREATPHMLAAALPLARETPSVAQKRLAAAAVGLLPPVSDAHLRDGILCAAELARDYTAMCDAALSRPGEGT